MHSQSFEHVLHVSIPLHVPSPQTATGGFVVGGVGNAAGAISILLLAADTLFEPDVNCPTSEAKGYIKTKQLEELQCLSKTSFENLT